MRIEQLRHLEAIVRSHSFRQAADDLGVAQPSLSQSIKKLEDELGVVLLTRSRRGAALTDAGESVMPFVLAILVADQNMRSEVAKQSTSQRGRLRLGTVAAASNTVFPLVVSVLNRRHPAVELRVTEAGSLDLVEGLLRGALDIAFISHLPSLHDLPEALEIEELFSSRLVACVPTGHALLHGETVTTKQLAGERLILFRRGYLLHDLMKSTLDMRVVNIAYYAENTEAATRMIAAGVGVSILPECSIADDAYCRSGQIQFRPIADMPTGFRICLARLRAAPSTSLVRTFWSVAKREAIAFR